MGNNQSEREYEEIRLKQTISLAEEQLKQAKEAAEKMRTKTGRLQFLISLLSLKNSCLIILKRTEAASI